MDCPACGEPTVSFAVPDEYAAHAPGERAAAVCTRCLTVTGAASGAAEPSFDAVSDAFPDGAAGVPMALLVGLLDSLATNRPAIEDLISAVEREGADPMLVLDRLAADGSLAPAVDLAGRRRQLEQLL
jgi:hypothetical protein